MRQRWSCRLMRVALVLALIVVGASSYLRLAGNGLGCDPWPACYGTTAALEQANQSTAAHALRLAHRVAASTFLLVAVAAVVLGWPRWRGARRAAAIALLAVTGLLAAIGRLMPSPLPWITWANVLGGFALVAFTLRLSFAVSDGPRAPRPARRVAVALAVLLLLQVMGGTLLSVRLTAAECQPACAHAPGGDLLALWRPDRAGDATALGGPGAGSLLQGLHRVGGLVLALVALAVAAVSLPGWPARAAVFAALAVLAFGFAATHAAGPAIGAAHALAAAWLIAALLLRKPVPAA